LIAKLEQKGKKVVVQDPSSGGGAPAETSSGLYDELKSKEQLLEAERQ